MSVETPSRLDAMVTREKAGKTYWTKVGAAFPQRNGGYKVILDALPVNGELHLMPPLPDDGRRGPPAARGGGREPGADEGEQPWANTGEAPF